MPHEDQSGAALAWRVTAIEQRADDDRKAQAAMIEQLQRRLHDDFLNSEQVARRYISREEISRLRTARRDWLLVWVAIITTAGTVAEAIAAFHH